MGIYFDPLLWSHPTSRDHDLKELEESILYKEAFKYISTFLAYCFLTFFLHVYTLFLPRLDSLPTGWNMGHHLYKFDTPSNQ
jgi:hypothetical protein